MAKKDFTLTSKILMTLLSVADTLVLPPHEVRRRLRSGNLSGDGRQISRTVYYLAQKGFIKYVDKNNERFVKLTQKGQLEALLAKARLPQARQKWDGKWRLIIFDIPEDSNTRRAFFRTLLKKNGFLQLQQSVYISPYPLNREALKYLQETRLTGYIRILKVEEIDNDVDLKKKFGLK
jgi:CRISPR-associated endonuclease Cas2